jgi:hypothetical protein
MRSRTPRRRLDEGQHQAFTTAGEEDRVVLIEWLNAAVGSKSYLRVRQLINNVYTATLAGDAAVRDRVYVHVGPAELLHEKAQRRHEIDRLLRPISDSLRRYVFHPRLVFLMTGQRRWWFDLIGDPVSGDYKLVRADGRRVYEADVIFGVLRLASWGFLDKIKQCLTCQKWLYAHPSHKKFCDSTCQLKYFASTPSQKEKRAAYMRDYRIKTKEKETREDAVRLATRPSHR